MELFYAELVGGISDSISFDLDLKITSEPGLLILLWGPAAVNVCSPRRGFEPLKFVWCKLAIRLPGVI